MSAGPSVAPGGGRYDFEDGGTYCGGWEDGKAHGHGVCTGPKGQGEYCGQWAYGFEACGIYTWPSGNNYQGQWMQGKRHGLGIERKDKWIYKGEWTQGFKGRYGLRHSVTSGAKYEGTWTTGLQDGYGCETYADGGTYQGQWLRGCRHGYGVRQSVPYGLAAHYRAQTLRSSLTSLRSEDEDDGIVKSRDKRIDETRGGFVLSGKMDTDNHSLSLLDKPKSSLKRTLVNTLKLRKQRSTGDISEGATRHTKFSSSMRSTRSFASQNSTLSVESGMTSNSKHTDFSDDQSFYSQDDITDVNVTECYMGEWKGDKRSGFGVSERSDGLKYEGEWYNNKKYGYGATTFKDGSKEEGKYKNNILISSSSRSKLMVLQKSKIRDRIDTAVVAAQRAGQLAMQKADIAVSRMANARAKAEQATNAAAIAKQDSDVARLRAKEIDPSFHQPGTHIMRKQIHTEASEPDLGRMKNMQYNNRNRNFKSRSMVDRSQSNSPAGTPQSVRANYYKQQNISPPERPPPEPAMPQYSKNNGHLANNSNHIASRIEPERVRPTMAAPPGGRPMPAPSSSLNPSSSKPRPSPTTPEKSFNPPPPKPRRMEMKTTLGQLINQEVLSDHFDHYGAPSLSRSSYSSSKPSITSYDKNHNHQALRPTSLSKSYSGYSPRDMETKKPSVYSPPEPSHNSMNDSLTDDEFVEAATEFSTESEPSRPTPTTKKSTPTTAGAAPRRNPSILSRDDTYITSFENDARKRISFSYEPSRTQDDYALTAKAKKQAQQQNISNVMNKQMGSLPDISLLGDLAAMPKEDLMKLSAARREEIRKLLEEQERRNAGDLSVLAGDLRKWFTQRQLMMVVVAANATLASVVFNMLGG